jgi:hypothetical protein
MTLFIMGGLFCVTFSMPHNRIELTNCTATTPFWVWEIKQTILILVMKWQNPRTRVKQYTSQIFISPFVSPMMLGAYAREKENQVVQYYESCVFLSMIYGAEVHALKPWQPLWRWLTLSLFICYWCGQSVGRAAECLWSYCWKDVPHQGKGNSRPTSSCLGY